MANDPTLSKGCCSAATSAEVRGYLGRCRSVEVFEKLNRLGEGTYGTVYRARDTENGQIVALKKVRFHASKEGFPRSSLREIRLLQRLQHPNIVTLQEVACGQQANSIFLVFEYCEHDVGALLDKMERPFGQAEVKCLVLQLLRAVAHLHEHSVMHRDLKLSNLLLTNCGVLKLADFGLAREFSEPPEPCTANVVTLWYRAPELLLGSSTYSPVIDIWSVGCNFGELLRKRPLMPGRAEEHQLQLICELLGTPTPKIWPGLEAFPLFRRYTLPLCEYNNLRVNFPNAPDSCLELLNKMLTFDPSRRASAATCLQHRYFSESPAPQEPQWMPTWREHRNEAEMSSSRSSAMAAHPAAAGTKRRGSATASGQAQRSALVSAAKRLRATASIF